MCRWEGQWPEDISSQWEQSSLGCLLMAVLTPELRAMDTLKLQGFIQAHCRALPPHRLLCSPP